MSFSSFRPVQPRPAQPQRSAGALTPKSSTSTPANQGSSTRRSLRIWRAITVLFCLAAGVVSYLAVSFTNQSVKNIDQATEQIVRLEQTKADLLNGQAVLATRLTLDPAQSGDEYLELLGAGAQKMAKAAELGDRGQIEAINRCIEQTPRHAARLGAAAQMMAADREAGVRLFIQADQLLQTGVIKELDAISGSTGQVILEANENAWVTGLLLIPIVLLIAASVNLARRTRRLLNIGLVVALAAMGVTAYFVGQALNGTTQMVVQSQAGPQYEAQHSGKALSEVAAARNSQSLVALGVLPAEQGGKRVDEAVQQLRQTAEIIADPTMSQAVDEFVTANQKLKSTPAGQGASSQLKAADDAAKQLDEVMRGVVDEKVQAMGHYAAQQSNANFIAEVLGALLPLVAALAAGFGLSQPLRRYR